MHLKGVNLWTSRISGMLLIQHLPLHWMEIKDWESMIFWLKQYLAMETLVHPLGHTQINQGISPCNNVTKVLLDHLLKKDTSNNERYLKSYKRLIKNQLDQNKLYILTRIIGDGRVVWQRKRGFGWIREGFQNWTRWRTCGVVSSLQDNGMCDRITKISDGTTSTTVHGIPTTTPAGAGI